MAGSGRRTFVPGEVLTASNVMSYLQDQAVMNFAGTAARGSAIGTAVSEGMVSYLQDTNAIEVYNGSAWNQVSQATSPNAIINGAFDIWQRGTSATINALNTYKTADRWTGYRNNGNATESQQAASLTSFRYCARYQRNSGNAATDIIWAVQSIETANSISFAGKSATLSFYARAGANFSSASSALKVQVVSGTGTDQNVLTGFTGEAFPVDQTVTLTTSWQRFTVTGSVGTSVTQLGVRFNYTPSGTASTNDYFEITGVQLEEGSTATPFRRNANSIQGELAACQRYYYRISSDSVYQAFGAGTWEPGSGGLLLFVTHPVIMRVVPTSVSGSNLGVYNGSTFIVVNAVNIGTFGSRQRSRVILTLASAANAAQYYEMLGNGTTAAFLDFSAEL